MEGQGPVKVPPAVHHVSQGHGLSEGLRVAPPGFFLPGGDVHRPVVGQHHIAVAFFQRLYKGRKAPAFHPVVGVNHLQVLALGGGAAGIEGASVAQILLGDEANRAGILPAEAEGNLLRGIGRAIVYHNDFQGLQKGRLQHTGNAFFQVGFAVIGGDDKG